MTTGGSAGGHLSLMGAGTKLLRTQIKAVCSIAGPADLEYGTNYTIEQVLQNIVDNYTQNNLATRQDCSPRFRYSNYTAAVGRQPSLYSNIQATTAKFYFVQNNLDTLVPNSTVLPFANSLGAKADIKMINEDDPATPPGIPDHNYVTTMSTLVLEIAAKVFV
jgi:hypothetical protein